MSENTKNSGEFGSIFDVLICPNCKKTFLRGVFLAVGSISDPKSAYHLEFAISEKDTALNIIEMAALESIFFKYVKRRKKHILYLKSSEQIEDFLYYIKAPKISFDLMETKILKEVRNNANRITNFESANLEKISMASAKQIEAVKLIIKKGAFESMPEELKQTAKLRLKHIELSIREIGEISSPSVSKSGILHRMQKIIIIANELK
jgi:DNA-binding protein WhiA